MTTTELIALQAEDEILAILQDAHGSLSGQALISKVKGRLSSRGVPLTDASKDEAAIGNVLHKMIFRRQVEVHEDTTFSLAKK